MKEFNLDAALNGEPVKLACGKKAYIFYDLSRYHELSEHVNELPLNGIVMHEDNWDKKYHARWSFSGESIFDRDSIIGMWEEPKISIEDLPKPFKPKNGEPFYYIYRGKTYCDHEYSERSPTYRSFSQNGQCFRSEKDAQKWLDFMKSMMW